MLMDREDFYKYKQLDLEIRAGAHSYIVDRLEDSIDPRSIEIHSINNDGGGMAVIYWTNNATDINEIEKTLVPIDILCSYTRYLGEVKK